MISFIPEDQKPVMKTDFFSSQSQDDGANLDGGRNFGQTVALKHFFWFLNPSLSYFYL